MRAVNVYVSRVSPAEAPANDMAYLQLAEAFVSALREEGRVKVLDRSGEEEDEPRASMDLAHFFVPLVTQTYVDYVSGTSTTAGGAEELLDFTLGTMLRGTARTVPVILDPSLLDRKTWPRRLREAFGARPIVDLTSNAKVHEAMDQLMDLLEKAEDQGVLKSVPASANLADKERSASMLRTVRRISDEALAGTRSWLHTALVDKLREASNGGRAARVSLQAPSGAGKSVFLAQFCLRGLLHNPASTFRELAVPSQPETTLTAQALDELFARKPSPSVSHRTGDDDDDDADDENDDGNKNNINSNNDDDDQGEASSTTAAAGEDIIPDPEFSTSAAVSSVASDAGSHGASSEPGIALGRMPGPDGSPEEKAGTRKRKSLMQRFSMRASRRSNATVVSLGSFSYDMPPLVAGAFFFRREDAASCSVESMVRTLAAQLCGTIPGFHEALDAILQREKTENAPPKTLGRKQLFKKWIAAPLRYLPIKPKGKAYIVLDGIEELSPHDARSLLDLLHNKWDNFMPPWLGTVVSLSSQTPPLAASFVTMEIDLEQQKNQADIELFLRTYLSRLPRHAATVARERARGLFLRARFLTAEKTVRGLKEVPTDQSAYLTMLLRKFVGDGVDMQMRRDMLAAVCVAREPMPLRLAADAVPFLTVADMDPLFDLVEDKVRFVHSSIAKILMQPDTPEDLRIDPLAGHYALSSIFRNNYINDETAARNAVYHLCRANLRSVAARIIGDFELLSYTFRLLSVSPHTFVKDCKETFFDAAASDVFAPPRGEPEAEPRRSVTSLSSSSGVGSLVEVTQTADTYDHDSVINSPSLRECADVVRALEEAADVIERDPTELAAQMVGRLPPGHSMRVNLEEFAPEVWLQTVAPSLSASPEIEPFQFAPVTNIQAAVVWGDLVAMHAASTLRVYSRSTLKTLRIFRGHDGICNTLAMDDDALVSGSVDRTIKVWSLASGACLHTLRGHSNEVTKVCLTESYIVSGAKDGCVMFWSRASHKCVRVIQSSTSPVVALDIDDTWVAVGRADGAAYLHYRGDIAHGDDTPRRRIRTRETSLTTVRLHGATLVTCGLDDRVVRIWKVVPPLDEDNDDDDEEEENEEDEDEENEETAVCLLEYDGHKLGVVAFDVVADGLAVSADAQHIHIWSLSTGAFVHKVFLGGNTPMHLAVDGNTLLLPGGKHTLREVHRPWGRHEHPVSFVGRDKEANLIVSAAKGSIRLWDAETGLPVRTLPCDDVWDLAMDDSLIVAALASGSVQVFSRETFSSQELVGHRGLVRCIDMDDEIIFTGSKDRTARVWLRETNECVAVLEGHDSMVTRVKVDDDKLITICSSGSCREWSRETSELLSDSLAGVAMSEEALRGDDDADDAETQRLWAVSAGGKRVEHRGTGAYMTLPSPVQRLLHSPNGAVTDSLALFDESGALHILRLASNSDPPTSSQML